MDEFNEALLSLIPEEERKRTEQFARIVTERVFKEAEGKEFLTPEIRAQWMVNRLQFLLITHNEGQ